MDDIYWPLLTLQKNVVDVCRNYLQELQENNEWNFVDLDFSEKSSELDM